MVNPNYLKSKLDERGIQIQTEVNFAGNNVRYFEHKGQKIMFDTETASGGTTFAWSEKEVSVLLFLIDNISKEGQSLYAVDEDYGEIEETSRRWGDREYLIHSQFYGNYTVEDGKVVEHFYH